MQFPLPDPTVFLKTELHVVGNRRNVITTYILYYKREKKKQQERLEMYSIISVVDVNGMKLQQQEKICYIFNAQNIYFCMIVTG